MPCKIIKAVIVRDGYLILQGSFSRAQRNELAGIKAKLFDRKFGLGEQHGIGD